VLRRVLRENLVEEAQRLIDGGMFRAGIATLGVFVEHALQSMLPSQDNLPAERASDVRPTSASLALRRLLGEGRVGPSEADQLRQLLDIRNRAIHDLAEPTAEEADRALAIASDFSSRYLRAWNSSG
jgi:hypothetical protein